MKTSWAMAKISLRDYQLRQIGGQTITSEAERLEPGTRSSLRNFPARQHDSARAVGVILSASHPPTPNNRMAVAASPSSAPRVNGVILSASDQDARRTCVKDQPPNDILLRIWPHILRFTQDFAGGSSAAGLSSGIGAASGASACGTSSARWDPP